HAAASPALHALRISLPVLDGDRPLASLTIRHRVSAGLNDRYLLRRIDQLHGSITETLSRLSRNPVAPQAAPWGQADAAERGDIRSSTHYSPPEGTPPASRVHALCRHWVCGGQAVRVVTCAPNVPDGRVYEGYRNGVWHWEQVDGVPTLRVWTYL